MTVTIFLATDSLVQYLAHANHRGCLIGGRLLYPLTLGHPLVTYSLLTDIFSYNVQCQLLSKSAMLILLKRICEHVNMKTFWELEVYHFNVVRRDSAFSFELLVAKKKNPQRAYMKQKAYIWNFLMCSLLTVQNGNIMWESLGGKVNYSSIGQYRELHWGSDFVLFFILCLPVNCLVHKRVSNSVAAAETKDCTAVWLWL